MKSVNAMDLLNENIRLMEIEQAKAHADLKKELLEAADNLKPSKIIMNLLKPNKARQDEDSPDEDDKVDVMGAVIGIATGFVARKVLLGSLNNPLTKMAGSLLQAGISTYIARHPDGIKNAGAKLFSRFFGKKNTEVDQHEEPFENKTNE